MQAVVLRRNSRILEQTEDQKDAKAGAFALIFQSREGLVDVAMLQTALNLSLDSLPLDRQNLRIVDHLKRNPAGIGLNRKPYVVFRILSTLLVLIPVREDVIGKTANAPSVLCSVGNVEPLLFEVHPFGIGLGGVGEDLPQTDQDKLAQETDPEVSQQSVDKSGNKLNPTVGNRRVVNDHALAGDDALQLAS